MSIRLRSDSTVNEWRTSRGKKTIVPAAPQIVRSLLQDLQPIARSAEMAPSASASRFMSTFNLGSMNVSDFSVPPNFLTGPFNYGFTALVLNPAATGQVTINSISVSADATLHHLPFYGSSPFDWEIFVGPSPFGFTPGQVTDTTVLPGSITSNAPTQFRSTQEAGTTIGGTMPLTGSYDFVSHTFQTNDTGSILRFAGTSPGEFTNGLYAQVFLWSEGGDSIFLIGMIAAGLRRKKG